MLVIDKLVQELDVTWDLEPEILGHVREQILSYAVDALMDSEVRKEIDDLDTE